MHGLLVAVEGIDGSGKSTLAAGLHERLKRRGIQVTLTREPTDLPSGLRARSRLSVAGSLGLADAIVDADLFFEDRIAHNEQVIRPALANGYHILTDRYDLGTLAYQSTQGLPLDGLLRRSREAMANGLVEPPALNLLVDVPVEVAISRLKARRVLHKFENPDFLRALRNRYLELSEHVKQPIHVLDGTLPPQEILGNAEKAVMPVLGGLLSAELGG